MTKGAFGLAGTAVGLAGTVARGAVHAPVGMTRGAIHLAGAAAGLAGTVARETGHAFGTDRGDESVAHPRGAGSAVVTDDLAAELPAPETMRRVVHALLEHQAGDLDDDATLLLVEWHGAPGTHAHAPFPSLTGERALSPQ